MRDRERAKDNVNMSGGEPLVIERNGTHNIAAANYFVSFNLFTWVRHLMDNSVFFALRLLSLQHEGVAFALYVLEGVWRLKEGKRVGSLW